MRLAIPIILAVLTLAPAAARPAAPIQSTPPSAISKLANTVVEASNSDNAAALSNLYANDAVVVDEVPPFVWRGAGAGVAWWRTVETFTKKKREHIELVNARISEFQGTATDAYLIQPITIVEITGKQRATESGTLTYTFSNRGGAWLISSQVWTTKP